MDTDTRSTSDQTASAAPWQPLSARERRVLGVLIEKAKTTPSGYPMTVNAIRTGANQKSNRHPLMECKAEEIEQTLDDLREKGAIAEVISDGRVPKYRHYAYDWLGVDKTEIAVMTELLLRGAQTEGELRGRASRMERIVDLAALREILASLEAKGLVVRLTPQGRGHVLSHALYQPHELDRLRQKHKGAAPVAASAPAPSTPNVAASAAPAALSPPAQQPSPPFGPAPIQQALIENALITELRLDVDELKEDLDALRREVADLRDALGG
jgi:hypothetical protein